MEELVTAMVAADPHERPSIDDAVNRFETIRSGLPWYKLRQRLVSRKENVVGRGFRGVFHLIRTTTYILLHLPAVPTAH